MPTIQRVTLAVFQTCAGCRQTITAGEVAAKSRKDKHKTGETKYYHERCVPRDKE